MRRAPREGSQFMDEGLRAQGPEREASLWAWALAPMKANGMSYEVLS